MTIVTVAPPILDRATKTEEIPRIPLESSAQYKIPQQDPPATKQKTKIFFKYYNFF